MNAEKLKDAANKIRAEYERAFGRPCDCATAISALHYGRAQGLEMAADIDATSDPAANVGALASEGWQLVPKEPTREMWAAMADTLYGYKNRHHDKVAGDLYYAMLAAAPALTPQGEETPAPQTPAPSVDVTGIIDAARDVIASASDSYKKRNGHLASFEDASGEKCWIVPFDAFEGLRAALAATEGSADV